jgi:hypothetical protein
MASPTPFSLAATWAGSRQRWIGNHRGVVLRGAPSLGVVEGRAGGVLQDGLSRQSRPQVVGQFTVPVASYRHGCGHAVEGIADHTLIVAGAEQAADGQPVACAA